MSKKLLSPAESDLFRKAIGTVKTIQSDKVLLRPGGKPSVYPKSQTLDFSAQLDTASDAEVFTVSHEDTLSYLSNGVQKNVLKKLRQGYFGVDAELDLHGLISSAAKQQLLKFLHFCVKDGCRCVHIIHGKGYGSPNNHPVLKNDLNYWLRQHNDVLAFCSAAQKHGGAGAVMVLLHLSEKYHD